MSTVNHLIATGNLLVEDARALAGIAEQLAPKITHGGMRESLAMRIQSARHHAGSFEARVRVLEEELKKPAVPPGYLPISTAPKDGTFLRLFNVDNGLSDVGRWCDYRGRAGFTTEGEWDQELGNGDMTHWGPVSDGEAALAAQRARILEIIETEVFDSFIVGMLQDAIKKEFEP